MAGGAGRGVGCSCLTAALGLRYLCPVPRPAFPFSGLGFAGLLPLGGLGSGEAFSAFCGAEAGAGGGRDRGGALAAVAGEPGSSPYILTLVSSSLRLLPALWLWRGCRSSDSCSPVLPPPCSLSGGGVMAPEPRPWLRRGRPTQRVRGTSSSVHSRVSSAAPGLTLADPPAHARLPSHPPPSPSGNGSAQKHNPGLTWGPGQWPAEAGTESLASQK